MDMEKTNFNGGPIYGNRTLNKVRADTILPPFCPKYKTSI